MAESSIPFVSFVCHGEPYYLESHADAVKFLETFRKNIEWIAQARFNDRHIQEFKDALSQALSKLINNTSQDSKNSILISSQFEEFFKKFPLPIKGTPYFEFIERLKQDHNATVAFGAAVSKTNWYIDTNSPLFFTGSVLRILYENGISAESGLTARLSLEKHASTFRGIVAEAQKTAQNAEHLLSEQLNLNDQRSLQSGRRILRHIRFLHQRRAIKSREAIATLEKTTAAYREQMRLKAPVEYWLEKSRKHRAQSDKYRSTLIKWGWKIGAIVLISLGF